ncbi:MAG: SagB/ThcOx family dehydrogenase [Myxococcales bacterium]|nr:SagB/ThcOx family dehydrogenase [Myxococcales bacterium]
MSDDPDRRALALLDGTRLDAATLPAFRDGALAAEAAGVTHTLRRYPGHPTVSLPRPRPRRLTALDATLLGRRSVRHLGARIPSAKTLGALLGLGFGVHETVGRGPTPSAGGLQSLSLYLAVLGDGWLAPGAWHYDREAHALAHLDAPTDPAIWRGLLVSADQFVGGALLWILVGDGRAIGRKYGDRAARFLLLEAGHLMQNLCLLSHSLGLCTLPLGGVLDDRMARALTLLPTDRVLYAGVCGPPA